VKRKQFQSIRRVSEICATLSSPPRILFMYAERQLSAFLIQGSCTVWDEISSAGKFTLSDSATGCLHMWKNRPIFCQTYYTTATN
jgi:hypothetical protein